MKLKKYMIAAALIMTALLPTTAKDKGNNTERVYMFGFAASFNDTIVHFTEIHPVDSVVLNKKTKFLEGREGYSSQLRNYMAQQMQMPHHKRYMNIQWNICGGIFMLKTQSNTLIR